MKIHFLENQKKSKILYQNSLLKILTEIDIFIYLLGVYLALSLEITSKMVFWWEMLFINFTKKLTIEADRLREKSIL